MPLGLAENDQAKSFDKFVEKSIVLFNLRYLRGFDCGLTTLQFDEFSEQLKKLGTGQFSKEKYKLFDNNCRDFCNFLIFNVLKPSQMETGQYLYIKEIIVSICFGFGNLGFSSRLSSRTKN